MGRKSKKYKADKQSTTDDIRELLRRLQGMMKPVMAPLSDGLSYSSSETSLPDLEELATIAGKQKADIPTKRSEGSLVMEGTLKALLDNLRRNLAADINSFKEEISGVSRHLNDTEISLAAHESCLNTMEQEIRELRHEQAQTQNRMAMMEDRRWKDVKIRGIPAQISAAEIPHFMRRLLTHLFSAKQAKMMALDGCFRLPAPTSRSTEVNGDVIVRFQNGPDRQVLLMALRNKSPYDFEGHKLTVYPDLSRATLEWRRSIKPLTTELVWYNIPYKWSSPKCLLIPRESGNLKIQEAAEINNTLQHLGLPLTLKSLIPTT
ncbi:Hypothetical predicted protein [Pelobates cultripes]|uniref:L1 transposable element RRM domain-containing protein n=1 Tax=Pelobates cultripes TaxID=61616 RepID=A0AAD1SQ11_PELCU|nr:Hypothetical predicted protein [Pelobates cultripes]